MVLGDLLAGGESGLSERPLRLEISGDPPTRYTPERFDRMAHKTGNYVARYGLGPDRPLGLVDDLAGPPVLGLYAAALLGAPVVIGPPSLEDVAVLVGPTATLDRIDVPPSTAVLGYGNPGGDARITSFEEVVPGENPGFPPTSVEPSAPLVQSEGQTYSHEAIIESARRVRSEYSLAVGDRVTVRASLSEVGTIVAGFVAPVVADATIVLAEDRTHDDILVERTDSDDDRHIDPEQHPRHS